MKFPGFLLLFCCLMGSIKAQTLSVASIKTSKNDTLKSYVTNVDGQLLPWTVLPDVKIFATRIFKSQADREAYNRLKYNVLKVLPYVRFAGDRYRQLERDLATTADKSKQKAMIKVCDDQIKDLFKREIENLTISQGEILIKLIDRETGNTSYDLAKQLKGGFDAFMFQSVARLFGHNLKQTYDRDQEVDIETILQQAGYDTYRN